MLKRVYNHFRSPKPSPFRGEGGQTLVEYSVLIALMSIALIGAVGGFQAGLTGLTQGITDTLLDLFG